MGPRSRKFRFYFDENFPVQVGKFLRSLGHNVTLAAQVEGGRLQGAADSRHLDYSRKSGRILVTIDRDFRQAHLARKVELSPGVIMVHGSAAEMDALNKILTQVVQTYTPTQLTGRILRASVDKQILSDPEEG